MPALTFHQSLMISASQRFTGCKGREETSDFGSQVASRVWGRSHCTGASMSPRKHCIVLSRLRMELEETDSAPGRIPTIVSLSRRGKAIFEAMEGFITPGKGRSGRISFLRVQQKRKPCIRGQCREGTKHGGSPIPALPTPAGMPLTVRANLS